MVALITILMVFLLGLSSCFMKESYKDFHVSKIDDFSVDEYFTSNELSFARTNGVVIAPYIHATNHHEYTVDIILFSKREQKSIKVKSVTIKEEEKNFFSQEVNQNKSLKKTENGILEEWVTCGIFTDEKINLSDGKKLYLTVEIQIENESQITVEEINYEVTVIQYKSYLTPT